MHCLLPNQVIPIHCISPSCTHNQQIATINHELFYCPTISGYWILTNMYLTMMQLPIRAFNYNDILILVSKYGTTTDIKEIVNLHIILITFFAINCIYVYKMDIRKYQHSIEQQKLLIKQQADKYYSRAIIRQIHALPFHVHNIKKHNRSYL